MYKDFIYLARRVYLKRDYLTIYTCLPKKVKFYLLNQPQWNCFIVKHKGILTLIFWCVKSSLSHRCASTPAASKSVLPWTFIDSSCSYLILLANSKYCKVSQVPNRQRFFFAWFETHSFMLQVNIIGNLWINTSTAYISWFHYTKNKTTITMKSKYT